MVRRDGGIISEIRSRMNRTGHLPLIFLMGIVLLLYSGNTDVLDKIEKPGIMKLKTLAKNADEFINSKFYLHPALTLPETSLKLPNSLGINIESSRLSDIGRNKTIFWRKTASGLLNFEPSDVKYGLVSISVSEAVSEGRSNMAGKHKDLIFAGLIRTERSHCTNNRMKSWTCQIDYFSGKNRSLDSEYCIIVAVSDKIEDILSMAKNVVDGKPVEPSEYVSGMFCGNPMLQRSTSGEDALFFINHRVASEVPQENQTPYYICKYSIKTKEVSRCRDTRITSLGFNVPLTIIYDEGTKVLAAIQYNDKKCINITTYDADTLSLRTLFRSIPSPSGWILTSGANQKGKIIFTGDSAPYETTGVFDLGTEEDVYHNMYF